MLKYAIGEIVLAVIGILIALQINNWNEERLQKRTLTNMYAIIAEYLKNEISDINAILKEKADDEPIFNKVLDGNMTIEEYQNCTECRYITLGFPNLSIGNWCF